MRHILFLAAVILVFAFAASAQLNPANYTLLTSPFDGASAPASSAPAPSATVSGGAAAMPQAVASVFENYAWQAYLGYTFFRFYEVPGITKNLSGFDYGMVYYFNDWLGADGDFMATFGSQAGSSAHYVWGGGGPRFRWNGPRGLELWGHGLIGYSHFTPQTSFGPQGAFSYEVGGGVDIRAHGRRWAYRAEAGMLASRFFNTYQFSPKVSTGIVFKF